MADTIQPSTIQPFISRQSPPEERLFGSLFNGQPANPYDYNLSVFTPASDIAFGSFNPYNEIFAREGSDTIYGFDRSLSNSQASTAGIDLLFGKSEPIPSLVLADLLSTLGGNPPSGGNERFVLGDANRSFYNTQINDFAFIADFNPNQDVIQLNGSAQDYNFVNIPVLGEAIIQKSPGSQAWQDGNLVGWVFGAPPLDPNGANFQYVGNTPPSGPVQPQIKQIGTTGFDLASGVATDPSGNVFVTGITNGSLGGPNAGSYDVWTAKYSSDGTQQWIKQFGSSKYDVANAIATDKWGNFYEVGNTQGGLAGPIQTQEDGAGDAWIGKFDSNGNPVWVVQLGAADSITPNSDTVASSANNVIVDDSGNVYVAGLSILLDPRQNAPSPDYDQSWVTKYDSNGNQQWFTQYGVQFDPNKPYNTDPTAGINDAAFTEAYGISLAPDGSVYTTGWTDGNLAGLNADPSGSTYDTYIAKFDNNTGNLNFIQQFGSTSYDFGWSVANDSKGNIYTYGWTQGNLGTSGEQLAGPSDLFLAKFSPDGTQQWIKQFGSSGDDAAFLGGLKIDSNDNIFVTGYTNGNVSATNSGSYDAFVERLDTDGNQVWTQQFGTPQLDYATNIAVDNTGDLYVTGLTEGSLGAINAGSVDGWVAKLDANSGNLLDFNNNPTSPAAAQSVFNTTQPSSIGNLAANGVQDTSELYNFVLTALAPPSNGITTRSATASTSGNATINGITQDIYNSVVDALNNNPNNPFANSSNAS